MIPDYIKKVGKVLQDIDDVLVISHIDADGITSAAIMVETLKRLDKSVSFINIKQLSAVSLPYVFSEIKQKGYKNIIFTDLGSGQINEIRYLSELYSFENIIIVDHHQLNIKNEEEEKNIQLYTNLYHINAFKLGMNGGNEISGSGLSFLLSYTISEDNVDLAALALVGAVGDMQNYRYGKLIGKNAEILQLAKNYGIASPQFDIPFFGIETRPLHIMLQYASPYIKGITGNRESCINLINDMGIEQEINGKWRTWTDLSNDEKNKFWNRLVNIYEVFNIRVPKKVEVIELNRWYPKTETRYAKEFSTLLNAAGRNNQAELGVRICLREPDALKQGQSLLKIHRSNLAKAIETLSNQGVQDWGKFYFVFFRDVMDTIIGIVIGMAIGSRLIPTDKIVLAATDVDGDYVKISGRIGGECSSKGYNLKELLSISAEMTNEQVKSKVAEAGGHENAAGAYVKKQYLNRFLTNFYSVVNL